MIRASFAAAALFVAACAQTPTPVPLAETPSAPPAGHSRCLKTLDCDPSSTRSDPIAGLGLQGDTGEEDRKEETRNLNLKPTSG